MPIKIENHGALRKVIISNPKKKNALSRETYAQLTDALNQAAADDSVTIVALTGDGDYYSSGNDITSFLTASDPMTAVTKTHDILKRMIHAFYTFSKVLICVVNGPCIGIAATTAALCDIIYAVDTAYFHTPFASLALCAEGCSSYTFPRIFGKSKASEMLLINHKLSAAEAYQFGFISQVYKPSELDTILWPKLIEYSKLPKNSLCATKELMNKFHVEKLKAVCDEELKELYKRIESEEFVEAVTNFMQRKSKL